ncbi:hypothetical protein M413DRAFT_42562, partial [Hebeloma cylindrosporum]
DIMMASPEKSISAYSSSCSTGDVFQSRAQKNTFNMADADNIWQDINRYTDRAENPEKGKIYLYISNLNLPEVDMTQ